MLVAVLFPGGSVPKLPMLLGLDKIAHAVLFFIWALSLLRAWRFARRFYILLLLSGVFAIGTEVLQLFVEKRSFDWFDAVADLLGTSLAYGFFVIYKRIKRVKTKLSV